MVHGGIRVSNLTEIELREAARAIASTRMKSEKAIGKLKRNSAQYRLTARGIAAYSLALWLIARELGETPDYADFSIDELQQAKEAFAFATERVSSILPKFAAGTPQHTLAVRRLRAFEIATALISQEAANEA
jgi:hypothetical protein